MRLMWLAATVVTLLVVDALSGLAFHTSTQPVVTSVGSEVETADRAIVVFPGYVMSGSVVARSLRAFLPSDYAILGVDYAERGVDSARIYTLVARELDRIRPREVVFYGASMGGLVASQVAKRYADDGQRFGRIVLILDSAPTGKSDIRRPAWSFWIACHFSGGVISSLVWAALVAVSPTPPRSSAASADLVQRSYRAGKWVGAPALTSQACFLAQPATDAPWGNADTLSKTCFLRGDGSGADPLVRTDQAIASWRVWAPTMRTIVVTHRDARYHLPLVEFPKETADAIQACITN